MSAEGNTVERRDEPAPPLERALSGLANLLLGFGALALFGLVVAIPGILVTFACKTLVADIGRWSYVPTAYLGLSLGVYGALMALAQGSFSRRMSVAIRRLRKTPLAEVKPGTFAAISGWVVQGEPVAQKTDANEPADRVTYPLVIEDGSGGAIRIPWRNGSAEPRPDDARAIGGPPAFHLGDRLFAAGTIAPSASETPYRAPDAAPSLVRGDGPLFVVHAGTQADTMEQLRRREPPLGCALVPLALLAMGIAAVVLARL